MIALTFTVMSVSQLASIVFLNRQKCMLWHHTIDLTPLHNQHRLTCLELQDNRLSERTSCQDVLATHLSNNQAHEFTMEGDHPYTPTPAHNLSEHAFCLSVWYTSTQIPLKWIGMDSNQQILIVPPLRAKNVSQFAVVVFLYGQRSILLNCAKFSTFAQNMGRFFWSRRPKTSWNMHFTELSNQQLFPL